MDDVSREADPICINPGEMTRVAQALLSNPNRVGKGATKEELATVLNWAAELKLKAALNVAILRKIYQGELYLDFKDATEVVMSRNRDFKEDEYLPEPEIDEWLRM
jgi:hypothetical protein